MAVPNSRNSRPLLPIGGVSKEDAPQVIAATWQHAINVTRRPLIRADILVQLSWALVPPVIDFVVNFRLAPPGRMRR